MDLEFDNKLSRVSLLQPDDFSEKLFSEIRKAKKYILIKCFTWKNDQIGQKVAIELLKIADQGVKVFIIKDKTGIFFEYGEPYGQSFFYDDIKKNPGVYLQARIMAKFYGHQIENLKNNPLKNILLQHPNVEVVDFQIDDHSKIVIVDGETSYVGGINIGDEFFDQYSRSPAWIDFMLETKDKNESLYLLKMLAGIEQKRETENSNVQFSYGRASFASYPTIQDDFVEFILKTKKELLVMMAYLGDPVYTEALCELLKSGRKVKIITAQRAATNRWKNRKIFQDLIRKSKGFHHNLSIVLSPRMIHAKVILRDNVSLRIGSQNMSMTRHIAETAATLNNPGIASMFLSAAQKIEISGQFFTGSSLMQLNSLYHGHIVPLNLESASLQYQTVVSFFKREKIKKDLQESQKLIKKILQIYHKM